MRDGPTCWEYASRLGRATGSTIPYGVSADPRNRRSEEVANGLGLTGKDVFVAVLSCHKSLPRLPGGKVVRTIPDGADRRSGWARFPKIPRLDLIWIWIRTPEIGHFDHLGPKLVEFGDSWSPGSRITSDGQTNTMLRGHQGPRSAPIFLGYWVHRPSSMGCIALAMAPLDGSR